MSGSSLSRPVTLAWRAAARLADTVVVGLPLLLPVLLPYVALGARDEPERHHPDNWFGLDETDVFLLAVILAWLAALPVISFVWSHVYEVALARRGGQTLGKRWLGVCVVRSGSSWPQVPCYGRLMLRWLILHPPAVALLVAGFLQYPAGDRRLALYGLGYLTVLALPVLVTRSRRGLHDLLAGTVVEQVRSLPEGHPAHGVWQPPLAARWQRWRRVGGSSRRARVRGDIGSSRSDSGCARWTASPPGLGRRCGVDDGTDHLDGGSGADTCQNASTRTECEPPGAPR